MRQSHAPSERAGRILDVAEELAQKRGFNGFSYADIAERLGVTKASLHYHYRSKTDLGRALIERYRSTFSRALEDIDRDTRSAPIKLKRYAALYDSVMRNDRLCLCGMLAAEFATLPGPMRSALTKFFDVNERWLARVLKDGRSGGALAFRDTPADRARVLLGALEGAMLVARSYGDEKRFRTAADQLLADLGSARDGRPQRAPRARRSRGMA
jgi:TetR/AcrR family transcriptional regulator, transcriptional repressor for nem operon